LWLHSLKVAQLLRSAACLHTNQSRSYLNHLVVVLTDYTFLPLIMVYSNTFCNLGQNRDSETGHCDRLTLIYSGRSLVFHAVSAPSRHVTGRHLVAEHTSSQTRTGSERVLREKVALSDRDHTNSSSSDTC